MITQVDEATVVVVAVERLLIDPAGQSGDAVGEPCLGIRACDQPGLVAVASGPAAINAWMAGSETTRSPRPKEMGAT